MYGQVESALSISKWILFTTLGWVIGFILGLLLAEPLDIIKLEFFGLGLGIYRLEQGGCSGLYKKKSLPLITNGYGLRWQEWEVHSFFSTSSWLF